MAIWAVIGITVLALIVADSRVREKLGLFAGDQTEISETAADEAGKTPVRTGQVVNARVIDVTDGETFTAIDAQLAEFRVRLAGIDAPAINDYFGEQAKENLLALISNKTINIDKQKLADDGAVLAKVYFDGRSVNLEQLRSGYAWLASNAAEFLSEDEINAFKRSETLARFGKLGLWTKFDVVAGEDADTVFNTEQGPVEVIAGRTDDKVFAFPGQPRQTVQTTLRSPAAGKPATFSASTKTPNLNPFGQQQAGSPGNFAAKQNDVRSKEDEDCKPDATMAELKVPESPAVEVKNVRASRSSKSYMAGPRGGCFYLTASGGKKYVDRSLCSQPMVAGQ
jgi:endonuclease YncB( thermonuclease family)